MKEEHKMDKKNMTKEEKVLQKAVNRMLADKFVQYYFYKGCIEAIKADERKVIENLFCAIANKKLNDHYKSFLKYAIANEFDAPIKFSEYEKNSDNKLYRCLETLKRGEDATYYIEKAVELEELMLKAADELADDDRKNDMSLPYEFMSIVHRNHYDDSDAKEMLNSLADAYKAGADYIVY